MSGEVSGGQGDIRVTADKQKKGQLISNTYRLPHKSTKKKQMSRVPLDTFDMIPPEMRAYLRNNGWSFNRKACEYAVRQMRRLNHATGKKEAVEPYSKSQAEELLTKYGIKLEHNTGYDFVYVLNMCRADYLKAGVPDEANMALFVKSSIDDADNPGGNWFRKWLVDCDAKGEPVDWEELL